MKAAQQPQYAGSYYGIFVHILAYLCIFLHILAYSCIFLTFKYAAYMHYVDELVVMWWLMAGGGHGVGMEA